MAYPRKPERELETIYTEKIPVHLASRDCLYFGQHIQSNSSLINMWKQTVPQIVVENSEVDNCMATCKLWLGKKTKAADKL